MILSLSLASSLAVAYKLSEAESTTSSPTISSEPERELGYNEPSHSPIPADHEIACLAINIYFEAGNQPFAGKLAVGMVTLNRVNSKLFPNTICDVVKQAKTKLDHKGDVVPIRNQCQFSWYCDGKADDPRDSDTWEEALSLARVLVIAPGFDITEGSLWYHANYVNPYWAEHLHKVITINAHIFYK